MRLFLILLSLAFLSPSVCEPSELRGLPLHPEKEILKQFNILTFALSMYYMDARERLSKDGIKEKLATDSTRLDEELGILFDLDNIDFRKKGFTRYYPFNVSGKDFIVRIFDMREKGYLPEFKVFEEGVFENSRIGFQIIPGINAILEKRKIKKVSLPAPDSLFTAP